MSKNEEKLSSTKYWIPKTPSNFNQKLKFKIIYIIGGWGWGVGGWGLGDGGWAQPPIPQSPIPNPQSPKYYIFIFIII